MFTVTVGDHVMIAHSLKGKVFGPAQALHGATYVVEAEFRNETLDNDGIVLDIGLARDLLRAVLDELDYRNLDDHAALAGTNTTTEVLARYIWAELANGLHDSNAARKLALPQSLKVILRETPVAWASYENRLDTPDND